MHGWPDMIDDVRRLVESGPTSVAQQARSRGYTIGPVHHGTSAEFNEFKTQGIDPVAAQYFGRQGAFFTEDRKEARGHAEQAEIWKGGKPRVGRYYLRIDRPLQRQTGGKVPVRYYDQNWQKLQAAVESGQADGVIVTDSHPQGHRIFAVFSPTQIKSADAVTYDDNGNPIPMSARFDPTSNDVRY